MYTDTVISNFWKKVLTGSKIDCWLWTGAMQKNGYGNMNIGNKKNHSAHRISYFLHKGEIPEGMQVMHKCDNRLCVNPEHLLVGSVKDNSHDMLWKGRRHYVKAKKANAFEKLALKNMKKRIKQARKKRSL